MLYNSPKHTIPLIMAQIFISYKRNNKEIVFKIVKRIESRLGVKCWIDVEGIESNSQFISKICHAIEDAKIVIFMHSAEHHNINYEEDYTIKELNYARHCNKRIILLKIDDAPLKNYFLFEYGNKNYRLASDMDQFEAMLNDIAKWLNIQIPDRTDITDALVLFQRGQKYASEQNYIEAVKFYRMAAEQGNAEAQNSLGYCYGNGLGIEKDLIESAKWHRLSAEQGNGDGQYNLALLYSEVWGRSTDAITWFQKAANQGHTEAQTSLALRYFMGKGIEQNLSEALKWCRTAAAQGGQRAKAILGNCYYRGFGVAQDYTEAIKWFRQAAEQGEVMAQKALGDCYYNGHGVAQDYTEAIKWYKIAKV